MEGCRARQAIGTKGFLTAYQSMEARKTSLERAFELARSGKCLFLSDIIKQLKLESYNVSHIEGRALKKQLTQLIEEAKR